jgi:translation elongation factor EF-G
VVPKEYIPGVEKGVQSVFDSGVMGGFPLVDTRVTLFDGAYHEVDSSAIAFEIATCAAMREGAAKAGVKLLEPIMDVKVMSPSDFVGSVVGDLNNRRGHIRSQEIRGNATVLRANVALARLFGYRSTLRSITNGLGSCAMRLSHYAEVQRSNGPDDFRPAFGMRHKQPIALLAYPPYYSCSRQKLAQGRPPSLEHQPGRLSGGTAEAPGQVRGQPVGSWI